MVLPPVRRPGSCKQTTFLSTILMELTGSGKHSKIGEGWFKRGRGLKGVGRRQKRVGGVATITTYYIHNNIIINPLI